MRYRNAPHAAHLLRHVSTVSGDEGRLSGDGGRRVSHTPQVLSSDDGHPLLVEAVLGIIRVVQLEEGGVAGMQQQPYELVSEADGRRVEDATALRRVVVGLRLIAVCVAQPLDDELRLSSAQVLQYPPPQPFDAVGVLSVGRLWRARLHELVEVISV